MFNLYLQNKNTDQISKFTYANLITYWHDPFFIKINNLLYNNPTRVYYVDEATDDEVLNDSDDNLAKDIRYVQSNSSDYINTSKLSPISLYNKILVNWSKKEFIDCNRYFAGSFYDMKYNNADGSEAFELDCLNPLPLMTVFTDFMDRDEAFKVFCNNNELMDNGYVGTWIGDSISIEDWNCWDFDDGPNLRDDFKEILPEFREFETITYPDYESHDYNGIKNYDYIGKE